MAGLALPAIIPNPFYWAILEAVFSISTPSTYEVFLLKAHWYQLTVHQCESKRRAIYDSRIKGRMGPKKAAEKAREAINQAHHCETIAQRPLCEIDDQFRLFTCTCNFAHPQFGFLLEAVDQMDKGRLPYPGSLSEQPNHAIELIQTLKNLRLEHQAKAQQTET